MAINIKIDGIDNAKKFLQQAGIKTFTNVGDAITKSTLFLQGEVVESIAGKRAEPTSVDTGRFKNSVTSDSDKKNLTGVVSSDVEYANHLEYGTSRLAPRRHFNNSAKRNEAKIVEFIQKSIK